LQFDRLGSLSWPPVESRNVPITGFVVLLVKYCQFYTDVARTYPGGFKCLSHDAALRSKMFLPELKSLSAPMKFIKSAAASQAGRSKIGLPLRENCGTRTRRAHRCPHHRPDRWKGCALPSRVRVKSNPEARRLPLRLLPHRSKTRIAILSIAGTTQLASSNTPSIGGNRQA
jgi:hypothetical protein